MEISNMKNIIVLKNLPSNLVEEAIVVLKSNKKIKKLEYIENKASKNENDKKGDNMQRYVIKEAESVISDYISKIEKQNITTDKNKVKIYEKKYKKMKAIIGGLTILLVISLIIAI